MTRRRTLLLMGVATVVLTLATPGLVSAHVTVGPEEVVAGDFETLIVTVPTEKEIPTTEVRVEVPEGFTVSGVQPVPGWDYEFEENGGLITSVTWSGGELEPQEFQQFLLSVQAPEKPGEYTWRAFQTYEDGSVVEWTGPPDAEEPASVVEVASSATESHSHSEHSGGEATVLADTGGDSPLPYIVFGVLALTLLGLLAKALVAQLHKA